MWLRSADPDGVQECGQCGDQLADDAHGILPAVRGDRGYLLVQPLPMPLQ
nr:hypothetical protein [Kibdelosporangium sp. MJ126-NF4]CTQ92895.1 hypothetical protein [Kibdelosporangium sp. MJ126-NF4]